MPTFARNKEQKAKYLDVKTAFTSKLTNRLLGW